MYHPHPVLYIILGYLYLLGDGHHHSEAIFIADAVGLEVYHVYRWTEQ